MLLSRLHVPTFLGLVYFVAKNRQQYEYSDNPGDFGLPTVAYFCSPSVFDLLCMRDVAPRSDGTKLTS